MLSLSKARYTCTNCGDCCAGWQIPLMEPGEADQYRKYAGQLISPERLKKAIVKSKFGDEMVEALALVGTACPVRKDDMLCGIHSQFGGEVKPHVCQIFPMRFVATPTEVRVGLSFACPAVVDGEGPPLDEQRADIEKLYKNSIENTHYLIRIPAQLTLTEGVKLPWSDVQPLIAALAGAFTTEKTLLRQAGLACALMALLETKMSEGVAFADAFASAKAGAPALLDEALAAPPAVERLSGALFRTLVNVTVVATTAKGRVGNVFSALFGGGGQIKLRSGGEVAWSAAEKVAPGLGAEGEALYARWFVDAIESCTFFGDISFGLSLSSGLDLLIVSAAVGAFLARAEAAHAGRTSVNYEDAKRGLRQLDAGITHRVEMPPRLERALSATDSIDLLRVQLANS
ncbi:MAG TPA: YkgJ family cysteine cluster protein [Polyangia bacterium]|jgi:Fe-S-cluster containining protein|nr:YkgJ family cysteine cluster protein [Polyangia bacterium]